MLLNFTDIKGSVHEVYSTTFVNDFDEFVDDFNDNGFMTRSGLEPNFLRLDFCCEVRLCPVPWWGRSGRRC